MRGQEPGSEHERAETDSSVTPASTPPPSFGQLLSPADDPTTPPILYGDAVTEGGEGDQQETAERLPWPSAGGAPIPVYPGPPPNLPAPEPPSWPDPPGTTRPATGRPVPLGDNGALPLPGHSVDSGAQPAAGFPGGGGPQHGLPEHGLPDHGLPEHASPESALPDDGQTRHWHPGHLGPPSDTGPHSASADPGPHGAPQYGAAPNTGPHGAPTSSAPTSGAPTSGAPAYGTPGGGGPQPTPTDALGYPPPPSPAPDSGTADTNPANPLPGPPHADVRPWNVAPPAPEPVPTADLPELPAFPGAKPWEVPGEEAEYDWFADPEPDDPQLTRTSWPKPELPSDTPPPGDPTWEPPPGFTAAAAGMQVWPSPVTDSSVPPWPAATGEPIPGTDYDALEPPAPWPGTPAVPANPQDAQHSGPALQNNPPQPPGHPGGPPQPAGHQSPPQPPAHPSTGQNQPPGHQGAGPNQPPGHPGAGPNQPSDPGLTLPVARQAEPGDIPVWPMKQSDDTGPHQLPELPFPPEVWGPKPALPAPRQPMALPPADSDTPPHGIPAFPGPRPPATNNPAPQQPPVAPPHNFQPPARQAFGNQPFAGQQGQTQPGSLFTPGGPATPPQPGHPGPQQPPAKGKKVLLAALGVLVLAGVATGAFFAYRSINGSKPADAAASQPPATTQPSTTATTDPPDDTAGASVLNSEQTDPKKLALTEAFPAKKIKIGGRSFTRVKTSMAENCEKVAAGPFADALRKQDCSRVLRATYVDSKRRYAVTTGLAVLPTKEAAVEADQAKNLSRNLWFRALPGSAGSGGDRIHIAGGYAAGLVWGRYIVFSYATYADGHTPTEKETGLGKISGGFRDQTAKVLERRIAAS
ncbi:hypothetical protein [Nonomuraea endophytica]|uniref:Uncharacterized protein n=1 Tax=Nonomuraea endophytica TaxID=714136 RepID=A0A7W7ZWL1_9ACTN|nr:hypothetical protein [Nonomuraea endophytica]MBB5075088.1 hypothetical protein [Nonomuraea endophytica]